MVIVGSGACWMLDMYSLMASQNLPRAGKKKCFVISFFIFLESKHFNQSSDKKK